MGNRFQKEPQGGKAVRAVLSSATKKSAESSQPAIVGVAGGTGSSRTTVVTEILKGFDTSDSIVIQHDSYYKDRGRLPSEERANTNHDHDHPEALETWLWIEHLRHSFARQDSAL